MQTKKKEILLDQIMGLLNTQKSAYDSLRFSQDYILSMRGTLKEYYEEIDFKFLDEQDHFQQEKLLNVRQEALTTISNQSEKVETFGRYRQVIIDPKKEEVTTQTNRLKTKKSLKLSEQIQKKVSSRDNPDEFTKKYDNLFDEIFFNQKLKEEAHSSKLKQQTTEIKTEQQKVTKIQEQPVTASTIVETKKQQNNPQLKPKILPVNTILLQSAPINQIKVQSSQNNGRNDNSLPNKAMSLEQSLNESNLEIVEPHLSELEAPFIQLQQSGSLSNISQQNNVCDLFNKEILDVLINNYAQNPTLVQSLKPQVRINYNDKKPLVIFKPLNDQPTAIIRINSENPSIRYPPSSIIPNNPPIKIHTSSSINEVKNSPVIPQINFNYKGPAPQIVLGQVQKPEVIENQQVNKQNQKPLAIEFNQKQQERLPIFLRKLRELTRYYPNFYSKQTLTLQNCNKLNNELLEAFNEVKKGIKKLKAAHLKYYQILQTFKRLQKEMAANITSTKKNDLKTLQFFKSNSWKVEEIFPELNQIKPHQIFQKRELNQLQFMTLLNIFEEIIEKLQKEPSLNLQDPLTFKIYMNARQKLWNFQKNLRLMSEDFYLKSILKTNLPPHILQSHEILNKKRNLTEDQKKRQVQRLIFLQQRKDIFATCCLGQQTLKVVLQN